MSVSSDLNDQVLIAKNALMTALGDQTQKYLNNMRMWFRYEWTKEQFDAESRKLLTSDKMHLHNKFFLAMLNKIGTLSAQSNQQRQQRISDYSTNGNSKSHRKRKRSSHFSSELAVFEPCDFLDYLEEENLEFIRPPNSTDDNPQPIPTQRYCVQELFLPDIGFMMGRFLVGAWQEGLINIDDSVAELACFAVRNLLKNIISAIVMKRKSARLTGGGTYYYDVGAPTKDIFVRNTVTRQKLDDVPVEIDKEITSLNLSNKTNDSSIFLSSCEELNPQRKHLITIRDLYNALQDRNIIPSHQVYQVNMERIIQMLH